MSTETIIVERRGRVGIIRFNRPQALNALNATLKNELLGAVEAFDADANVGCILLTGSDKAFAAGADIKEMADKSYIDISRADYAGDYERLTRVRKPLIAAVAGRGGAEGGGFFSCSVRNGGRKGGHALLRGGAPAGFEEEIGGLAARPGGVDARRGDVGPLCPPHRAARGRRAGSGCAQTR